VTGPWQGGLQIRCTEWGQTPIADHLCTACGYHQQVVGRENVRDFMHSDPIGTHTCTTAA
jgi:hypothetical protein